MAEKKMKKSTTKTPKNSGTSLKGKITALEKDLLEKSEETMRISDKNIRLLAEFDNYKRRTHEERSNLLKYGGEELAKALLPILDDLHRTLETDGKTKARSILEGVELIMSKLDKTLVDQGIVAFDSVGQDFDPDRHEALVSEDSDKGEDVILKEFEKGYMYHEKIIRHAKVVVSNS